MLLTGANFLLRLAGMGFQVFLSRRIGAEGVGLLHLVMSVSALSFTVGSAGVRTCATYLSAGELGRGRPDRVGSVLSGCCQYSLLFSSAAAAALWCAAPWLCRVWIGSRAALAALRLSALFLPVRCLQGVLTGYFTAAERTGVLVAAAFLEQGCAMAVTFLLLSRWAGLDAGQAAFAVTAGGGCADALGLLLLLLARRGQRRRGPVPYGSILRTALPLALADTLRSGLNTIEDLIIPRRLALFAGTVNAMADYGMLRGMVFPVLMFPAAALFSLAELLTPEFSRCAARGSRNRVRYLARRGLRAAMLFGLCAGGLLFTLAGPLGTLLYGNGEVGRLLRLYAPFVPLLYADALVDAMCKGLGGYYFSFAASHLLNFALSLRRLTLAADIRPEPGKPALAAVCTAAAATAASLTAGNGSLLAPGGCYLLLLGTLWSLFRVAGKEDVQWLMSLIAGRCRS